MARKTSTPARDEGAQGEPLSDTEPREAQPPEEQPDAATKPRRKKPARRKKSPTSQSARPRREKGKAEPGNEGEDNSATEAPSTAETPSATTARRSAWRTTSLAGRASRDDENIWSTWTPSPEANVEFRWRVVNSTSNQGVVQTFPVQIFFVQHLGSLSPPPSRRQVQILADNQQELRSLVVDATMSPSEPILPFSLFSPNDPKPLFSGTVEAIYPAESSSSGSSSNEAPYDDGDTSASATDTPADSPTAASPTATEPADGDEESVRLVVLNLIYRPGPEVPEHQLEPALSTE
ncbi:MAG: hypothetical protein AAGC60_18100 [Acidobacteriota bacterium]